MAEENGTLYAIDRDAFVLADASGSSGHACGPVLSLCIRCGTWCNLACGYCISLSDGRGDWAALELTAHASSWLSSMRSRTRIVISGGEPAFYPQLAEFVRPLREAGHFIVVTTNGTRPLRIDPALIDWVDVSLHVVDVVVGGSKLPAPTVPAAVVPQIGHYARAGLRVSCNVIVSEIFDDRLRRLLDGVARAGARKIRLARPILAGRLASFVGGEPDWNDIDELARGLRADHGVEVVPPARAKNENRRRAYLVLLPDGRLAAEVSGPAITDTDACIRFAIERIELQRHLFVGEGN